MSGTLAVGLFLAKAAKSVDAGTGRAMAAFHQYRAAFAHCGGKSFFLQFENKALYRDLSIEKAEDLMKSPQLDALNRALGSQQSRPVHYYAAVGDVSAAFLLGERLGPHQPGMSIVRSSQLQWQQLADANVLFLGPPRFFGDKLASLPVSLEITEAADGFRVVHPEPGEPSLYRFRDPTGFFAGMTARRAYSLPMLAGPVGNTDVMTFASNSTFGRVGAIEAFTDAGFARTLVAGMRGTSGHIPRDFQVCQGEIQRGRANRNVLPVASRNPPAELGTYL